MIRDGTGNGNLAKVNSDKMLNVGAMTESREHYISHKEGQGYKAYFTVTPTGADDCFAYIKNDSEIDMIISRIKLYVASNEIIIIQKNDSGTPSGGTAITPQNTNLGSGHQADGTFEQGNDITGLSDGNSLDRIAVSADGASHTYEFYQSIVIPKNRTITFYAVTGGINIHLYVSFNYHKQE